MKLVFLGRKVQRSIRRRAIPILSSIILSILIPQLAISLLGFPIRQGLRITWPFLDYPMYSRPHYEGDRIPNPVVVGVQDELGEVLITPEDLGVPYWYFMIFVRRLLRHDRGITDDHTTIREFVHLYETRQGTRLSAVRVENRGPLVSKSGIRPAPPEILPNWSPSTSGKE